MRHLARQAGHPLAEHISPSCTSTGAWAAAEGRIRAKGEAPQVGDLFLVPKAGGGYQHVGLVVEVGSGWVGTNEGNTNDEGSREGYEVCRRVRGTGALAFVRMG
jgi:hypothetical protein